MKLHKNSVQEIFEKHLLRFGKEVLSNEIYLSKDATFEAFVEKSECRITLDLVIRTADDEIYVSVWVYLNTDFWGFVSEGLNRDCTYTDLKCKAHGRVKPYRVFKGELLNLIRKSFDIGVFPKIGTRVREYKRELLSEKEDCLFDFCF